MSIRRMSLVAGYAVALTGAVALATPYWIAYEADGRFPEEEGWTRITHAGGAQRYFADGALVLDGLACTQIVDSYQTFRPGALDPGAGELFIAQWRLRVDEVSSFTDPAVSVLSDDSWAVLFDFDESTVFSVFEPGLSASFEPYVYHDFELRSSDMRYYDLLLDGEIALAGSFHHLVSASRVTWGDAVQGSASLSRWEYVRFGAVPEPSGAFLLTASVLAKRRIP